MANDAGPSIDVFDRLLGSLHGLPEVSSTKPATVQTIEAITGMAGTYIVQTYRQLGEGDTIFLQAITKMGTIRVALPPAVADAIARQRDSLTGKSRSRAAKAVMEARIARGDRPTFKRKK